MQPNQVPNPTPIQYRSWFLMQPNPNLSLKSTSIPYVYPVHKQKTVCFLFSCDEHTWPTYTVTRDPVCSRKYRQIHVALLFIPGQNLTKNVQVKPSKL